MEKLALFVNSSDGFKDCWPPFFTLFKRYGGAFQELPIYLNTERKRCEEQDLRLISTCTWPQAEAARPTWSECLLRGLDSVQEPFVLYLQEDYFLTQPVRTAVIEEAVCLLESDPSAAVVYLTRYGPQFERDRPYRGGFVEIQKPARYLLSTQAAVWRKSALRELVAPWENGWMFEKFGSVRAARSGQKFISVARDIMQSQAVIDHVYTGVIKGQWQRDCVELFKENGISVDFGRRGFYQDRGRLKSRIEVAKKLVADPRNTLRSLWSLL